MARNRKMTIVATTISLPVVLESYAKNAARYGSSDSVEAIVIGDRKTPPESTDFVRELGVRWGFSARYVDVAAQEKWLGRFGDLAEIIPYNSDNRRNIGFLMALEEGCDVLLSIDDDNYCTADDFYSGHSVVGQRTTGQVVASSSGWFNICELLENDADLQIYPRGFPAGKRRVERPQIRQEAREVYVAANAGLWLGDPDIDAVTRLFRDVQTIALRSEGVILGADANSPINTQNTAICRDAIPAYYYVVMGHDLGGLKIDRYGDIWSGFFLKKCMDHLGHYCAVGRPLAQHLRNRHDLYVDLKQELYGMMITEPLSQMLSDIELAGNSYPEAYVSLSERLQSAVAESEHPYLTPTVKTYLAQICANMRTWIDVCDQLAPRRAVAEGISTR